MVESEPRRPLVVDASAAIAIIRSEALGATVAREIARHRASAGRLIVPDQFWLELANVLTRRYGASPEQVVESFLALDDLEIESIRMDRPLLLLALDLQHRHGLSAYDAVYLALAEAEDAWLLSLDASLAAAAGARAVTPDRAGPRRLAEDAAAYRGDHPIDWARFGPYLARLRAETRLPRGSQPRSRSVAGSVAPR